MRRFHDYYGKPPWTLKNISQICPGPVLYPGEIQWFWHFICLLARGQRLNDFDRVKLGVAQKNLKKNGISLQGEIKPILSQMGKLESSV